MRCISAKVLVYIYHICWLIDMFVGGGKCLFCCLAIIITILIALFSNKLTRSLFGNYTKK